MVIVALSNNVTQQFVHPFRVETAGDCYIVAGGLMHNDVDGYTSVRKEIDPLHALTVLEFAKVMNAISCVYTG